MIIKMPGMDNDFTGAKIRNSELVRKIISIFGPGTGHGRWKARSFNGLNGMPMDAVPGTTPI